MLKRTTSTLLAGLLAVSLFSGCGKEKAAGSSSPAEPSPDTVVATYGDGQKITYGELNEHLKEPLANLEKQKFQTRKQGLESFVAETLVKAEAKKRNLTENDLIKAEVTDKIPQPSEEQLQKVYEENKAQMPPGTTYEQIKPRIIEFLTGSKRQEAVLAYVASLKTAANVKLTLPEPPRERKEVAATGPSRGPDAAPITIVEFSDFECPFCGRAVKTVDEVLKAYPDKVKLVFRHFPLEFHKKAPKAAEGALCAQEQNKFWEFHDALFADQALITEPDLKEHAKKLGLDTAKFDKCLDSGEKASVVKADQEAGAKVGVTGTPAFFINGILLSGAQPLEEFKSVIDGELQAKK